MEDEQKVIERQTAKIASIKEISTGRYMKQEGYTPNFILSRKNERISRVNLMGVVVTIPDEGESIFVDDGTGKIEARTFEDKSIFGNVTIGDIVLLIGRPREFNNQIYLNCEILKKINDKDWLEYRRKQIILKNIKMPDHIEELAPVVEEVEAAKEPVEEIDKVDEVLLRIKELDKGSGCEIQEIINKDPSAEQIIEQLLLKGEIFEISSGKVKILD